MQKRLVIEFPRNAQLIIEGVVQVTHGDKIAFSIPLQEVGNIFDGKALMEATREIPSAVVNSLCEDFVQALQKQQLLSMLRTHQEDVPDIIHTTSGPKVKKSAAEGF